MMLDTSTQEKMYFTNGVTLEKINKGMNNFLSILTEWSHNGIALKNIKFYNFSNPNNKKNIYFYDTMQNRKLQVQLLTFFENLGNLHCIIAYYGLHSVHSENLGHVILFF